MESKGPGSFQDLPEVAPASQSSDGAKEILEGLLEYPRKVTGLLFQEIKSESRAVAVEQLALTSRKLDIFAEALREAAGKLREKQSYSLANIIEIGSENVMRVSNKLRVSSPETITGELQSFARRKPGIFLGAAVVTGILLGQLIPTSGEQQGAFQEFHPRKETSIEYTPGRDEEGYYERH